MFTEKLLCFLALIAAVCSLHFEIKNNSPETPVFVHILGTLSPEPFILDAGEQQNFTLTTKPWIGKLWGRIDCFSIEECNRKGKIPVSLAEIFVSDDNSFHDLNLVDGFNINLSISPIGGTLSQCKKSECSYPILDECLDELKFFNNDNQFVSCQSSCNAFGDSYCCKPEGFPEDCKPYYDPDDYTRFFKTRCPDAYTYLYDDNSSITCDIDSYIVTFM